MTRVMLLGALVVGLGGCLGGGAGPDGHSDTADPMCPVIEMETACVEAGFPHVARRWRYPDHSPGVDGLIAVTTVDDEWPPANDSDGNEPYLQATWCAMDSMRPQDSDWGKETPSPYREDLQIWWSSNGETGRQVRSTTPSQDGGWERRLCFDYALPVAEVDFRDVDGERIETIEYPHNIPKNWEQCWPDAVGDQLPCPTAE